MNVLIVGASSGIGREVAHVFSREGHNVICSARDEEELGYLVSDLHLTRHLRRSVASVLLVL